MVPLEQSSALDDLQRYVSHLDEEHGFCHRDIRQECLLLDEEIGELFKTVRKHEKMVWGPHR